MKERLIALLKQLNQGMVGREETMRAALLTLLAGENLLLVGPPGTGKSMLARRVSQALAEPEQGGAYFEYLLTKFSTPEELFGPLSISALKQDRFHRQTQGYLPSVQLAFLDEIFKASSSILNALLTVLNERKYHNGTVTEHIPLQGLVAASNELPKGQAELAALYDRFLVRRFVGYLESDQRNSLFALPSASEIAPQTRISREELDSLRKAATQVSFPPEVQQAVQDIWQAHQEAFKEDTDEVLSDRRWVKVLQLLRVSAASNGRAEVDFSDLLLLKDCLWNNDIHAEKVLNLIRNVLHRFDRTVAVEDAAQETTLPVQASAQAATAPASSRFKGLKGSGSETDPIWIETIDHFARLADPEIGCQGLYFRQTADIDGTALGETWVDIEEFQGHYDGGGFTIRTQTDKPVFNTIKDATIIHLIHEDSRFSSVQGKRMGVGSFWSELDTLLGDFSNANVFASSIRHSSISACQVSGMLATSIEHSYASHCHCGSHVATNINHVEISVCQAGAMLIYETATQSQIRDCLVILNYHGRSGELRGGIAKKLDGVQIERCFVQGSLSYRGNDYFYFSGIAWEVLKSDNSITHCALGRLQRSSSDVRVGSRIVQAGYIDDMELSRNISIDLNNQQSFDWNYTSDRNGKDGLDVAAAQFNAYYLEHQLGWDFETVWEWPQDSEHPILRPAAPDSKQSTHPAAMSDPGDGQTRLLALQCRNNIWLNAAGA